MENQTPEEKTDLQPEPEKFRQRGKVLEVWEGGDAWCEITLLEKRHEAYRERLQTETLFPNKHFHPLAPTPGMKFWWYPEEERLILRDDDDEEAEDYEEDEDDDDEDEDEAEDYEEDEDDDDEESRGGSLSVTAFMAEAFKSNEDRRVALQEELKTVRAERDVLQDKLFLYEIEKIRRKADLEFYQGMSLLGLVSSLIFFVICVSDQDFQKYSLYWSIYSAACTLTGISLIHRLFLFFRGDKKQE
jgi:hypothetical protein